MTIKEEFLSVVKEKITRKGIDDLVNYLENESDFFVAPASTQFHGTNKGDLAKHSLTVYKILVDKAKHFELDYTDETLAISGLFHDLCKVNFYEEKPFEAASEAQIKYLKTLSGVDFADKQIDKTTASKLIEQYKGSKVVGVAQTSPNWIVKDILPLGHGEKSIFILQKYIDLTDEEAMAIRWHMASFDTGIHFNYPSGYPFKQAAETSKLVTALFTSDYESDKLLGV